MKKEVSVAEIVMVIKIEKRKCNEEKKKTIKIVKIIIIMTKQ